MRLRSGRIPALALVGLLGWCSIASAQSPEAPADTAGLATVLRDADVRSWHVRATLADGLRAEGDVQWRGHGIVQIGQQRLTMDDIGRLERRVRTGGGGLKGFWIGAAVGTALLYGVSSMLHDGPGGPGGRAMLTVTGAGVLVGGGLGALIGSGAAPGQVSWVQLWP